MPNSLKVKFKSLRYRCLIDDAEYRSMCKKLDGHDSELLDEVGKYLFNSRYASDKIADFDFDQTVTFTKAEWYQILEEMKAEVTE